MKKIILSSTFLICMFLCSCSLKMDNVSTEENTSVDNTANVLTTEVLQSKAVVSDEPSKVTFKNEKFPIIREGVIYGWAQINFIEKLGIWDFYNKEAVQNGVKESYAINLSIDMAEYLKTNDSLSIECQPYLIQDSEVVGTPCNVGWSGFSNTAELYDKNNSGIIEVNLQPHNVDLADTAYLRLDFASADGAIFFDSINIDRSLLVNASDGPDILTIDDKKVIESINGAQYSIKFSDVYRELHDIKDDANLKRGSYWFYDFVYKINYVRGPQNSREVLTFDSFSDYDYVVPLKIKVQSDVDSTVLNDNVYSALRLLYSDRKDSDLYCFPFEGNVKIGKSIKVQNNRLIPDTTKTDATYLRFIIEFSEEQSARTDEELMNFNGRYVVWQIPFSERELKEKPK